MCHCSTVVNPTIINMKRADVYKCSVGHVLERIVQRCKTKMDIFFEEKPLELQVFVWTRWSYGTRESNTLSCFPPDHLVRLWQAALCFFHALWSDWREKLNRFKTRNVWEKSLSSCWTIGKIHKDVLPVTGWLASRRDIHNNRSMSVPQQLVNDLIIPLMTADNIGSKSIAFPQQ